jgi:hypothetical protein
MADRLFDQHWLSILRRALSVPALKPVLVAAVLLNWIYLCRTLP